VAARKWKNELLVNTTTFGNQYQPSVTALADGGFAIAWRDDGPTDDVIRWQRYNAQGVRVGAEQTVTTVADLGNQSLPDIVQLGDGNLWIVQRDQDAAGADIEGAVFALDGTFVRNQEPFTSVATTTDTPRAASLGANGSVAVFRNNDANGGDIQIRFADAAGVFGSTSTVNTAAATLAASQYAPDVAASRDGSRVVVVWTDDGANGGDIKARVFNAAGAQVTAEFAVNSLVTGLQRSPSVAWISATKFVVVWETLDPSGDGDGFAVKYIIRNEDGTAFGTERLANSATESTQGAAAVTALPDGGFAIAWVDYSGAGGDTSFSGLKLQVFDGAGNKRGGEILVNTTTAFFQGEPSLATLADGRIIVTWRDDSSTGGDTNLSATRAQIVDPRDGVINGAVGDDTLFGHDAVGDEINGLAGDDTAFGFAGNDQLYGGDGNDTLDGGKGDDAAFGGDGDDGIKGGLGDDELFGEFGLDVLEGGGGADLIDGGDGANDTASYFGAAGGVTVSLDGTLAATGDAAGDEFFGIERLWGSNFGADTLKGNDFANVISGFSGADTINASLGNDRLAGGAGIDTLTGGLGIDRFEYNAQSEGGDIITDFTAADDSFGFRSTAFGGLAAGGIAGTQFIARADNVAQDGNDFFIFRTTDKTLWFDVDGSLAAAPILIADLQASATMTSSDIVIF
jgi:Ca2+-binding RTX toxin-like protein